MLVATLICMCVARTSRASDKCQIKIKIKRIALRIRLQRASYLIMSGFDQEFKLMEHVA